MILGMIQDCVTTALPLRIRWSPGFSRSKMMLSSGVVEENAEKKGVQKSFASRGSSGSGRAWPARIAESVRRSSYFFRSRVDMNIGNPRLGCSAAKMPVPTRR
jgi:hypothetical protein